MTKFDSKDFSEAAPPMGTLRDFLRILFRQKAVILISFAAVIVTVAVGLKMQTRVYEARAKILISAAKQVESLYYKELNTGGRGSEITLTQSEIVKSSPVIERTVLALQLQDRPLDYQARYSSGLKRLLIKINSKKAEQKLNRLAPEARSNYQLISAIEHLRKNVGVQPIPETNTFLIKARDFDPTAAAQIANALSRSYLIYDLEQQLAETQLKYGEKHSAVMQLRDNIALLTKTLHGRPVPTLEALGTASSKVVEQASVPVDPVGRSKPLLLLVSAVMSVFLGVILAFVFDGMDQTFKSPQEVESFLHLPYLGCIPENDEIDGFAVAELCEQIYLLMREKQIQVLVLAGIEDAEESASVTAALATHLPEKFGKRILVIDADMHSGSLKSTLGISADKGLAEILEGKNEFERSVLRNEGSFAFLAAGKSSLSPLTLLDSSRFKMLLSEEKNNFDLILIHSGPMKQSREPLVLSGLADAVAVVVSEGGSRRQVAKAVLQPFRDRSAPLIGAILNNRRFVIPKLIYEWA